MDGQMIAQVEDEKRLKGIRAAGTVRQTEPAHYVPNAKGGLAFVPRRGVELGGYATTKQALLRWASDTPLRLLSILPDVHPTFGLALWNALRLSCKPSDLQIIAVQPGKAQDANAQDDNGTAAINALFESLPPEIGGLNGLQTSGMIGALLTGLPFYEAVPGARNQGLRRVYPIDSLTIRFAREGDDRDCVAYQLQQFPQPGNRKTGGYVALDPLRMFWRPLDTMPDDPYGRAPYAPALGEVLRDLALMQDLTDAVHNAAWPRLGIPFNFKEMFEVAQLFGFQDALEARSWVQEQFQLTVTEFNKLNPSDNLHYDAGGEIITLEGGKGLSSLEPILIYLRQRIVQSLKSLPTLMGINDGSTQTYTSIEWAIYASGLESIREVVVNLLVKIATLHLQLLGLPLVAKAIYEPIRTTDAAIEVKTEAQRILNEERKRDNGWQTNDSAAQAITGSDAVAEPDYAALQKKGGGDDETPGKDPVKGEAEEGGDA